MRLNRASPNKIISWTFKKLMKNTIGQHVICSAMEGDKVEVVVSANTSDSEIADFLAEKNIKKNSLPFI